MQYPSASHAKNDSSMRRMCAAHSIAFEATDDPGRLRVNDYDYLWLPCRFVSPDAIPAQVRILYGPSFFVFPEEGTWLNGARNADWSRRSVFTALSDWCVRCYKEISRDTVIPLAALPFGVDLPAVAAPDPLTARDCLVYFKMRHPSALQEALAAIAERGLSYTLMQYGHYQQQDYLCALRESRFCVWIGCHESQGFALQECLAADVPVLLWDAVSMFDEYVGDRFTYESQRPSGRRLASSTATTWSDACGEVCTALDFREKLQLIDERSRQSPRFYGPRAFLEPRVSDVACMRRLLSAFCPDVFLVTSAIDCGSRPWSYSADRSVFSAGERLAQTLRTLRSIRAAATRSGLHVEVVLVEASALSEESRGQLRDAGADVVVEANDEEEVRRVCLESSCKGHGEVLLTLAGLRRVPRFRRLFKLSGRYWLDERFEESRFSDSAFTFRDFGHCSATTLYSVAASVRGAYEDALSKTLCEYRSGSLRGYEEVMPALCAPRSDTAELGVGGLVAVNACPLLQ